MARNKAKRPGDPPRSASTNDRPDARSEGAEQARAKDASPEPAAVTDRPQEPVNGPAGAAPSGGGMSDRAAAAPSRGGAGTTGSPAASATDRPPGGGPARPTARRDAQRPAAAARSLLYGLGGGLIGGAIVGLLFHLLPQEAPGVAELRSELDQLRQNVSQLEQPPSGDLLARVAALEAQVPADQDLAQRLQAMEAGGAALREQIAALQEQVGTIDPGAASAAAQRVATLEGEVADLAATVAGLRQAVPSSGAAGDQAVADLRSRIDALEGRLGRAEATAQQLDQITGRLDAVEQEAAAASGLSDDVVSLRGQVEALSTRVDALAENIEQVQQSIASIEERRSQAATLALALARLDAAIEAGEPVDDLLDGLRDLEADPAVAQALEALKPVAESGVPTLPELRSSFAPAANRIVAAARAPEGDGLLQQAAGNLMSLITVRPVGADVQGDDAAARVARAEAALDRGDLAAAVAELEALQGRAAEAAAPWLADARQRLAVHDALSGLQEHAAALLGEQR